MLKKIINSFSLILETAKKEKELIFKDSAVIEIYIVFVTLVYFFYTFVYSPEIFTNLPVAYVDNDQTTISHQIRRMINETESLEIAYDASSLEEAKKLFEEGKVNGVIVIPKYFSRELQLSGGNASISIYSDASYMLYYDKTLQAVTNSLGAFTGALQLNQTMMSGVPMKQAEASSKPFNIIANPLYNLEEGYAIFLIPVVLIIALQTLQLTGMGVLYGTMRENDTFITNFAMAKGRFGYFFMTIGRAIPYLIISMLLLLLGILVVFHIFTIPQRGNIFEIIVFLIPVVLSITFLGQSLMNIFRNREDTIMLLTVFSIPALMMGGVSYPIVAFPLWIKIMAFFFPSTIGVKGFLALSQAGAPLSDIKEIFIQMWLICGFYFVLAVWTNRRFIYGLVPNKIPSTFGELKEFKKNKQITDSTSTNTYKTEKTINKISEKIKHVELEKNSNNSLNQIAVLNVLKPYNQIIANCESIISNIETKLTKKTAQIPIENLQIPPGYLATSLLENLRSPNNPTSLNNVYINLLANTLDKSTVGFVHPSFTDTVRYLSPDEIILLELFKKHQKIPFITVFQISENNTNEMVLEKHDHLIEEYKVAVSHPEHLPMYLENLIRIGILSLNENSSLSDENYISLVNCELVQFIKKDIENKKLHYKLSKGYYKVTAYGLGFIKYGVTDKN